MSFVYLCLFKVDLQSFLTFIRSTVLNPPDSDTNGYFIKYTPYVYWEIEVYQNVRSGVHTVA